MADRFFEGAFGFFFGKNDRTGSSTERSPSETAKPMAVEVKLFDSEKSA